MSLRVLRSATSLGRTLSNDSAASLCPRESLELSSCASRAYSRCKLLFAGDALVEGAAEGLLDSSACSTHGHVAIKKSPKHYHLDWTLPPEPGAAFENLVAVHLLKWVHFRQDVEGLDLELRYFRDVDGREVDFVVTDRRTPVLMVECKLGDAPVDPGVRYLKAKFPGCAAWQIHAQGSKDYQTPEGIRVAPAVALLATLI